MRLSSPKLSPLFTSATLGPNTAVGSVSDCLFLASSTAATTTLAIELLRRFDEEDDLSDDLSFWSCGLTCTLSVPVMMM